MKTYLINSIKQVSVNSQSWDTISTLKAQEWIVYNEDISQVEKFLFIDDKKLLVSVNGKSSYSKWEYIKVNSSLIIDDEINKYLLKIVVCNKDIIVLNVDSTNDYSFLINSKSSVLRNPTYADIQWYLIRNCGVDILNEQQRNQFSEEKKLENEKKEKEQQEKERDIANLVKTIVGGVGIAFFIFVVIASIRSCIEHKIEYEKRHPLITVTEEQNKVAVDLGLSVKWATCNVGANSPEEYGNYYGWGEVTGQKVFKSVDSSYNLDYQYPPRNESDTLPLSITNSKFDMAKANWGGKWRLPTQAEALELLELCQLSEPQKINGSFCYKVTGPNGNYIYFPTAGYRYSDGNFSSRGYCQDAIFWTGEISSEFVKYETEHEESASAVSLLEERTENGLGSTGKYIMKKSFFKRWYGLSVRAVMDK